MALGIVPIGNPPFAGSMEAAGIEPAKGFRRSLLSGHRDLEVQVRRNLVRVVVAAELDLDPANRAAQSVGGPQQGSRRSPGNRCHPSRDLVEPRLDATPALEAA
jgi:hypothetical protein